MKLHEAAFSWLLASARERKSAVGMIPYADRDQITKGCGILAAKPHPFGAALSHVYVTLRRGEEQRVPPLTDVLM